MTPCPDCSASRICAGHWKLFDPNCIHCGARLIQQIPKFSGTTAEATQRRRAVLADWVKQGHDETELRELAAAKKLAYEPAAKAHAVVLDESDNDHRIARKVAS